MRILTGVAGALIMASSPQASAAAGDEKQDATEQQIQQLEEQARSLLEKVEAMKATMGGEQDDAAPEEDRAPARFDSGLESRLDDIVDRSPMTPLQDYSPSGAGSILNGITWGGDFSFRAITYQHYPVDSFGDEDATLTYDQNLGLYFEGSLSENTKIKAELRDARVWGTEPFPPGNSGIADTNLDMRQAYLEVREAFNGPFNLRIGRQVIEHGSERIFGEDEWFLQRNYFDGLTAETELNESTTIHLHALRLGDGDSRFNNELSPGTGTSDANVDLFGIYASNTGKGYGTIEGYYFYTKAGRGAVNAFDSSFGAGPLVIGDGNREGRTRLSTVGVRVAGGPHDRQKDADIKSGVWWDAEIAKQFGTADGMNISNFNADHWMCAARLGFRMEDGPFRGVYAGYDYVEGGSNPFVALFPTTHGNFGILDIIGWENVQQLTGGVEFSLLENGDRLTCSYHILRLEDGNSAFGGPGPIQAGNPGGDQELGQELDLVYTTPCPGGSQLGVGAGVFFPGDAYTNAFNSHNDVLMGYMTWGIGF